MRSVKILEIKNITHDVKSFKLEKPFGYRFKPGQATEVAIAKDGWEERRRPFTFTSLNSDKNLEFIIKGYPVVEYPNHEGVTEEIHKLRVGDKLLINDPWGTINYKGEGIFIAGGAGITPFIAIFRDLASKKKLVNNMLIFSNKTEEDIILHDELSQIFEKNDLILTLTQKEREGYEYGRVDRSFIKNHVSDLKKHFYICGPKEMVDDLKIVLSSMGVSADSVVFEE